METKHSPTPWHTGGKLGAIVYDADGQPVANAVTFNGVECERMTANASRIVNAVNSHDELLAACKALVALVGDCLCDELNPCWRHGQAAGTHWGGGKSCVACTARAAIAKAEGQDGAA